MLYRVVLAGLFVVAAFLTLNERRQEQRARELAERPLAPIAAPPAATLVTGAAAPRPAIPFVPHRVRVRREVDLLQVPDPMAKPVEPISRVPPGILVQAVDERSGWYLIDTNLNRGWAPMDAFDEP